MMPRTWLLKNPHTLSIVLTLHSDGTVNAEFPAIGCRGTGWDSNPWAARDKAILACAEEMVRILKEPLKEPLKETEPDEGEKLSRAEAALASAERRHEEEIANQYKLIEAEREDRKVATARINKLEGALRTIADHGRQLPWAECARLANAALGQP